MPRRFPYQGNGTRFQRLQRRRSRSRDRYRLVLYDMLAYVILFTPNLVFGRQSDPLFLLALVEEFGDRKTAFRHPIVGPRRFFRPALAHTGRDPRELFRFDDEQIERLIVLLELPEWIRTSSGYVVDRRKALSILLNRLVGKSR